MKFLNQIEVLIMEFHIHDLIGKIYRYTSDFEVGGIPVNFADEIMNMKLHYQNLYLVEELHIDRFETKFKDIVVLDDRGRKNLEEAHECFLVGVMLDCIQA